ncbi:MraY family glycosyltransferase [Clostridium sp.]|uniref:MraY family glycosyltransferase n=1 Tax=Clostridium sp. TaxID=1506 RepID=UPI0039947A83
MFKYFIAIISSYVLVTKLIPIFINISFQLDFTDKPTERKKHEKNTPLVGGICMHISFSIMYLIFSYKYKIEKSIYILLVATLILLIGLVDDYYKSRKKEFPIMPRVIVQILSASLIFSIGIVFKGFTNPINGKFIFFHPIIQYIFTITWIFGLTTVINWSDGMDGIAGSIASISSITLFFVSLVKVQSDSAITAIILLGSVLGFLKFNKYPAKVFMGDSGANFLGFILSIIALEGSFKQATLISVIIPFIILGIPIFDNIFVIIKRFINGKEIYKADRSQIHYRLQKRGLNKKQIFIYISILSGMLSIISIILALLNI